jgi:hypothetical protein
MLRLLPTIATLGLAVNLALWSIPLVVGASAAPQLLSADPVPTLAQALSAVERTAGPVPSLPEALLQLIGAESEALEVAGFGLQPGPLPDDLASHANHASARVLEAVKTYIRSAQAVLERVPHTQ